MFISKSKLYLFPKNSSNSILQHELVKLLHEIKFISDAEKNTGNAALRFLSGEKFLSRLHFLGCSPDVEFQPDGDNPYIYIEIPETNDRPKFISGSNLKVARCPSCKKDLSELSTSLKKSASFMPMPVHCTSCQASLNIDALNWRKTACYCSSSIIVNNIYESEAVPDDQLLLALEQGTGFSWKYSYIRLE